MNLLIFISKPSLSVKFKTLKIQNNAGFQEESSDYRSVYMNLQKVYSKIIKTETEVKALKNLRVTRNEANIYIYTYI